MTAQAQPQLPQPAESARPFRVRRAEAEPARVVAWAVAQRVRAARLRAALSLGELATRAGLPQGDLERLERGRKRLPDAPLRRVASALGLAWPGLLAEPPLEPDAEERGLADADLEAWGDALDREDAAR